MIPADRIFARAKFIAQDGGVIYIPVQPTFLTPIGIQFAQQLAQAIGYALPNIKLMSLLATGAHGFL